MSIRFKRRNKQNPPRTNINIKVDKQLKLKLDRYILTLADLVDNGFIAENKYPIVPKRVEELIGELITEIGHTLGRFWSLCSEKTTDKLKNGWKGYSDYKTFHKIVTKELFEIE